MQDRGFVWIDTRWSEVGWLEAFRLRLTGWLPAEDAAAAMTKRIAKPVPPHPSSCLKLTERGTVLTKVGDHSRTKENCALLANVLRSRGFNSTWMVEAPEDAWSLNAEDYFAPSYKVSILLALEANKNIVTK